MTTYLTLPHKVLDELEELICTDLEQAFSDAVEARLRFMQMRGVSDPYELSQLQADYVREHLPQQQKLLDKYLSVIPPYVIQHKVPFDEFAQCWALMGTIWNTVSFERIRPIVALQKQYPILLDVARRVGRIADNEGPERVPVGSGSTYRMEHSSPSDIEGISVGNDLSALLPIEMATMADEELSGLFAYRYATRRLQTFLFKSNLMKKAQKVQVARARQKGPMIVCMDTSGSMQGPPERIAHSLIIKLLQIALAQKRDLLLITFSDKAKTFDVRANRTSLLDYMRQQCGGSTDGTEMLQAAFRLIGSNPRYGSADLLLISDFKFPLVERPLLVHLNQLQDEGTRLYALQIGQSVLIKDWLPYFDSYWHLDYKVQRIPWFIQK